MVLKDKQRLGQYSEIIKSLENQKLLSLDQLWPLIDSYIALGQIPASKKLLEEYKDQISSIEDLIEWKLANARTFFALGKIDDAINELQTGFKDLDEGNNQVLHARLQIEIGRCFWRVGKLQEGLNFLLQVLKIFDEKDEEKEDYFVSHAYQVLGNILLAKGQVGEAIEYYKKALPLREGHAQKTAELSNNIGLAFFIQGRYEEALKKYEQVKIIFQELGNPFYLAVSLTNIAHVYFSQGQLDDALEYYKKALNHFDNSDTSPYYIAGSIYHISRVLAEKKDIKQLLSFQERFPAEKTEVPIQPLLYMTQAIIAQQQNNWGISSQKWQLALDSEGLEFHYQMDCYEGRCQTAFTRWQIKPTENLSEELENYLNSWQTVCKLNYLSSSLCKVYLLRAKLDLARFRFTSAERLLEQCIQLSKENGLPLHQRLAEQELEYLRTQLRNMIKMSDTAKIDFEQTQFKEFKAYLTKIGSILEEQQEYKKKREIPHNKSEDS
jgi:tetratricopeptide (TPR) repeat protein